MIIDVVWARVVCDMVHMVVVVHSIISCHVAVDHSRLLRSALVLKVELLWR